MLEGKRRGNHGRQCARFHAVQNKRFGAIQPIRIANYLVYEVAAYPPLARNELVQRVKAAARGRPVTVEAMTEAIAAAAVAGECPLT